MSTTAADTLRRKSSDEARHFGRPFGAKALKAEGVEVPSSPSAAGTSSTSTTAAWTRHPHYRRAPRAGRGPCRRRLCPPDRQARLRRDHRRAGLHQRHDRRRQRLPGGKPDAPHRRRQSALAAQDGLAAGPAPCGHDAADHQVRRRRAGDRAGRRHGLDGGAGMLQRAPGPLLSGDPAGHPRRRGGADPQQDAVIPAPVPTGPRPRRSAIRRRRRAPGRPAGEGRAALHAAGHSRSGPAAAPKRRSRCCAISTFRPTSTAPPAACCRRAIRTISTAPGAAPSTRPTSSSSSARPSTSAWATASACATMLTVVQIDMDYRTVGKNRDISLRPGRRPRRHPQVRSAGRLGPRRQRRGRAPGLARRRSCAPSEAARTDKLMPLFKDDSTPIHPLPRGLGDQRVPDRGHDLHRRRRRRGDDLGPGRAAAPSGPLDGPGPSWHAGVGTGFAMATKLAHPDKEVLCYYGDGSFGMTAFDMETAQPLRRALSGGHRQQLGDEPDPLRPDRQVRRAARQRGQ